VTTFTVADVPGLIPGAAQGKGLGLDFLRHIERCAVLVHVLDCATLDPGRDPISDLNAIEDELTQYRSSLGELTERPRLVALNKIDVPEAAELAELVAGELAERGWRVFEISAASHAGLRELGFAMAELVTAYRAAQAELPAAPIVLRPATVGDTDFTVSPDPELPGGFLVQGRKPERWVRQTQFDNDEAVGFLADRLARLGVEVELARLGAEAGASVRISDYVFDFEPTGGVLAEEYQPTRRGVDERLVSGSRRSADERLAEKKQRRVHRSDEELAAQDRPT